MELLRVTSSAAAAQPRGGQVILDDNRASVRIYSNIAASHGRAIFTNCWYECKDGINMDKVPMSYTATRSSGYGWSLWKYPQEKSAPAVPQSQLRYYTERESAPATRVVLQKNSCILDSAQALSTRRIYSPHILLFTLLAGEDNLKKC